MPVLPRLASLWRNLTGRARVEQELDDEMRGYVELLTTEKIRAGMSPAAARRAALAETGGVEYVKEEVRAVRTGVRLETFAQDLRFGLRGLRKHPGFTAVAVATLALGIGANSAIFSLVNAVLLRPLPFREPDRLITVHEMGEAGTVQQAISGHEYVAWRDGNTTLDDVAFWTYGGAILTGSGDPEALSGQVVSANFFTVLGVTPLTGRGFAPGEDEAGATSVVVLSEGLWRRRFAADSAVIGTSIVLNDQAHQVVGVMPSLEGIERDVWLPMDVRAEAGRVGRHNSFAIARLRQGVTHDQALADLEAISARLTRELPDFNTGHHAGITPLRENLLGDVKRPMYIAFGAVAFVLLIACVNVAHLQLTRAAARQREIALRGALGAGRGRLVSQMLTESCVVSALGGVLGLMIAALAVRALPTLIAADIPRLESVSIDGRVLAVTLLLVVLTGLLSGVVPALRGSRPRLQAALADGARSSESVSGRLAGLFVVSEIALALVLLVGAGLMMQSFVRVSHVSPGFNPERVVAAAVALPGSRYPNRARQRQAWDELIARMGALPGVRVAAATSALPLGNCCSNHMVVIEGKPASPPGQERYVPLKVVTSDYFRTMEIPLLRGRVFTPADARIAVPLIRYFEQQGYPQGFDLPQSAPVGVISETMAREFWPGEDPVGRRFRVMFSPWITVVGVVADVRHAGLDREFMSDMYLPFSQEPREMMTLVVRTSGDPAAFVPALRRELRAFDRDLPIVRMSTMDDMVGTSVAGRRFNALLLALFGVVALVLSLIGTYGVISYGVAQRTQEIGIRAALGARAGDVLRLVLGRALRLTLLGIAIGLTGAFLLTGVLTELLFGVKPHDPVTFATIALLLMAVSLAASYLPTRRALRVDPIRALRS
ncbi:MAG TPA: ABC transporter permease [Gemmatimonadaceae bacterium]|nr:ABC transporter permease [Gemmatimonadaceae bacterium]